MPLRETMAPSATAPLTLKEEGNALFKRGDFARALEAYSLALESHEADADAGADATFRATVLANRAATNLKLGNLEDVVDDCAEALDADGSNAKARFRRAEALQRLGRLEEALQDMAALCRTHPKSREFEEKARAIRDEIGKGPSEGNPTA